MAKSLRSKRKRAMRAIKRKRYGVKELAQLKKIAKIAKKNDSMTELRDIYKVEDGKDDVHKNEQAKIEDVSHIESPEETQRLTNEENSEVEDMNVSDTEEKTQSEDDEKPTENDEKQADMAIASAWTTQAAIGGPNKHGTYPVWRNHRKQRKMAKKLRRQKKRHSGYLLQSN